METLEQEMTEMEVVEMYTAIVIKALCGDFDN